MKKLIIVESPAKIKTISKFLGKEFIIASTMGHIKDLPSKTLGVTMDKNGVEIEYVVLDKKDATIADICRKASSCDIIYLAPDPDREGEIIAWHIAQEIAKVMKKDAKMYRIWFNEITKPAIIEAIEHPNKINIARVAAQQARRILDRWVGYKVSPILWKKLTPGLSAGRVQSVALRLICDREKEIRAFKPEEYWSITGTFGKIKEFFTAALSHIEDKKAEIKNQTEADSIVKEVKNETPVIEKITDKKRAKNPNAPFMTSTLQQAAANQLGFTVKKTMSLAQKLYEGLPLNDPKTPVALITYMRTDSLRLSDTAITQARSFISKHFQKEYLPDSANVYARKSAAKAQEAHEAIRPIDVNITPKIANQYLPKDEARLYELIWKCFVACQMTPAEYAQRQVEIKAGKYLFKATGSTLLFDGYLKVYPEKTDEKDDKVIIPDGLKEKEKIDLKKLEPKQHFTQAPPRYSEASLVKEMEKEGIGRPSTYAATLSTIQARAYTTLDKKRFVPTELGMAVTDLLVENLPQIMDIKFTAHMEEDLDKVEQEEMDRDTLLKDFYKTFEKDLDKFLGEDGKEKKVIPTDITCPECKKEKLNIRFGKTGEFLGCAGYPDCTFTSNFSRDPETNEIQLIKTEQPKLLDEKCPQCGSQLRELVGRYGPFVACSAYPECKYIKQQVADFACPKCGSDVVKRKWRGGEFWGCSNYPTCKMAIFDQPIKQTCPDCGWNIMAKKITKDSEKIYCANKECPSNAGAKTYSKAKSASTKTAKAPSKTAAEKKTPASKASKTSTSSKATVSAESTKKTTTKKAATADKATSDKPKKAAAKKVTAKKTVTKKK